MIFVINNFQTTTKYAEGIASFNSAILIMNIEKLTHWRLQ